MGQAFGKIVRRALSFFVILFKLACLFVGNVIIIHYQRGRKRSRALNLKPYIDNGNGRKEYRNGSRSCPRPHA